MKVSGNQVFRDGVASISEPLQSALDVIERWARDAYVVCGKPCTQEGFEAAWEAEDADAYAVWVAGRASLAANAPAGAPHSAVQLVAANAVSEPVADLPEALRRSTAADGKTELFNLPGYPLMVRAVDFNRIHAESEMRRAALLDEMQKAALAAGQAVVQDDVVALVRAAQAFVLEPDWYKKKLELEAMAWGLLAAATQPAAKGEAYAALPTQPSPAMPDNAEITGG